MERLHQQIIQQRSKDGMVTGLLAVAGRPGFDVAIDGFDVLLLTVTKEAPERNYIHHYSRDGYTIQERWISEEALQHWILFGENRNVIEWIMQGEILLDRDRFLAETRQQLMAFPREMRTRKLLLEFAQFLRRFLLCKEYLTQGHILDAYTNIMEALFHWARLSIIEQGAHPEVTLWEQVRTFNPGIHKLYDELISSKESLEQRVRLVLLACDFNVMSKMGVWCELLLQVLGSRKEPFSPTELKYHEALSPLHIDLTPVLRKLVLRGMIREELVLENAVAEMPQIRYTVQSNMK